MSVTLVEFSQTQIQAYSSFIEQNEIKIFPYQERKSAKISVESLISRYPQLTGQSKVKNIFHLIPLVCEEIADIQPDQLQRIYENHLSPFIAQKINKVGIEIIQSKYLELTPAKMRRYLFDENNRLIQENKPSIYARENEYTPIFVLSKIYGDLKRNSPPSQNRRGSIFLLKKEGADSPTIKESEKPSFLLGKRKKRESVPEEIKWNEIDWEKVVNALK